MMTGLHRAAWAGALLLAATVATSGVKAQSDQEFDKIFPFIGGWDADIGHGAQDRGNCGGRVGDAGEKLLNCSLSVDNLPLNARAEAWLKYMDTRQSPTIADCAQIGLPAMLMDLTYISAYPGRLVLEHPSNPWYITRTVYMNGSAPKPIPGELFQHGLSQGRFDGDDLVIETTNFTFDPDGLDDHLHMASSVRKKVTERYQRVDDTTLRLIITLEDPTFLTRPFTYARLLTKRNGGPNPGFRTCDPEVARNEVEFAYPGDKYPDGK
jgi:hypothetical protein